MWKTILLCASLFGAAALGLMTGSRWVEPAALPAAAAIGLCLIGIVLILAAPTPDEEPVLPSLPAGKLQPVLSHGAPRLEALERPIGSGTGPHDTLQTA
jgi:hypothetical protein